ncbi:MAG: 4-hydroxythreonine-4-phosphate dehydrogenase PdxA [Hyphomicrobiaceae bacterium]|nr:4-hydroxythreonine-4-phosphate dehydrogenase PdxA [Hyphomicrobiaceae bacterium]
MRPHSAAPGIAPLAVTMGDPAGIGLEITVEAWRRRARAPGSPPFALYADPSAVAACCEAADMTVPIREIGGPGEATAVFSDALPVVPVPLAIPATPGAPEPANAVATIRSIDLAVADVIAGRASAIVTNPIAKAVLYAAGFSHPGHTEYLAHLASRVTGQTARPVMMLVAAGLRTVPVTIHIPLARVPTALTTAMIEDTVAITSRELETRFGITHPRIVVAGLNPHAGEGGSIGTEDRDLIAPAIERLRARGLDVTGPHPADTLFHTAARARYDAAVCMYHDQALIPVKTLGFDTGVNVTLGLPFIRTSPDHGTAFDIAGRGLASPDSLIAALELAARMAAVDGASATASHGA